MPLLNFVHAPSLLRGVRLAPTLGVCTDLVPRLPLCVFLESVGSIHTVLVDTIFDSIPELQAKISEAREDRRNRFLLTRFRVNKGRKRHGRMRGIIGNGLICTVLIQFLCVTLPNRCLNIRDPSVVLAVRRCVKLTRLLKVSRSLSEGCLCQRNKLRCVVPSFHNFRSDSSRRVSWSGSSCLSSGGSTIDQSKSQ